MNCDLPAGRAFSADDLADIVDEGQELGCHTFAHCHAWETRPAAFEESVLENKRALEELFPTASFRSLSYPIATPRPQTKLRVAKYYSCSRGGVEAINVGTTDANNLSACFLEKHRGDADRLKRLMDENSRVRLAHLCDSRRCTYPKSLRVHTGILSRNCQLRGWFRSQGASGSRSVGHTDNRRRPCATGHTSPVLGPRGCESLGYNFHNGGTIFALNQPMSLKIGGRVGVAALSLPLLFLQTSSSFADPIPSDRRINWQGQVGVPGGIPNRTTIYQTISSSLGNGSTNAQPAINGAVNSCPDNQVIKLPDGVFSLDTMVRPSPSNKGNFTIRGNGPGRTILKVNNGNAAALLRKRRLALPLNRELAGYYQRSYRRQQYHDSWKHVVLYRRESGPCFAVGRHLHNRQ